MKPEYIIMHHSLTEDGKTVSWGAIRKYHTIAMGWKDIGYHYGIELIDDHYEILLGRMPNVRGAHCKEDEMNNKSLGICVVGNFDITVPPPQQWWKAIELVDYLMVEHNIPKSKVLGHREVCGYKTCPGTKFNMHTFWADLG